MTITTRRLVVLALAVLMVAAVLVSASLSSENSTETDSKAGGKEVVAIIESKAGGVVA
jgi:hypothetical protein